MDVRCTRCSVEYEFDDAKVNPAGVTVKCTSCGHVFKVKPEGVVVADEPAAPSGDAWTVRTSDGTTLQFKELTTLQKWIVEQKVGRSDQISKTGKSWKQLGEIAELASFFQVVDAAKAAQGQVTPTPTPTPTPMPTPETSGSAAEPPAAEQPAGVAVTPPAKAVEPPPPGDTRDTAKEAKPPSVSGEFYAGSALTELDEEDPVLQWQRRARARNAIIGLVVVVVGGCAALFFLARPTFDRVFGPVLEAAGMAPAETAPAGPDAVVERVDEALRGDEAVVGEDLIAELTAMLDKESEVTPGRVGALARLHAAAARRNADASRLLGAAGAAAADKAAAVAKQSDQHLAEAYKLASRARTLDASSPEPDLAFAAYQAAKGATGEMRADLAAAREKSATGRAGVVREASALERLAAAEDALSSGDVAAMTATAQELANAGDDDARLVVARVLLRARAAADDATRATVRADVDALAKERPGDNRLALLLATLPATGAAAPAADAGTAEDPEADGDDDGDDDDDDGDGDKAKPRGGASYSSLLKKAERQRMRDRASAALTLYERAADLKPQAAKPWAGMGWCYLDKNQPARAVTAFEKAIQRSGGFAEAHFGLAESQRFAGQKTAAVRSYQRYLELAPNGPDAAVARNAIKSLQ